MNLEETYSFLKLNIINMFLLIFWVFTFPMLVFLSFFRLQKVNHVQVNSASEYLLNGYTKKEE